MFPIRNRSSPNASRILYNAWKIAANRSASFTRYRLTNLIEDIWYEFRVSISKVTAASILNWLHYITCLIYILSGFCSQCCWTRGQEWTVFSILLFHWADWRYGIGRQYYKKNLYRIPWHTIYIFSKYFELKKIVHIMYGNILAGTFRDLRALWCIMQNYFKNTTRYFILFSVL